MSACANPYCPGRPSTSTRIRSRTARSRWSASGVSSRISARIAASIVSPNSAATASDAATVVAEPVQAPRDHLAHAVRHAPRIPARPETSLARQRGGRSRRRRTDCRWSRGAALRRAPRRRPATPARAIQRAQCAARQPADQQPAGRRLAGEPRQRGGERIRRARTSVSRYVATTSRRVSRQVGGDELEQLERGTVRPVDVVQHDDQPGRRWRRPRESGSRCRRDESARRSDSQLSLGGSSGIRSRSTGNTCASSAPQEPAAAATASCADLIDPPPERRVPRPERRRRAVLPAASPPHRHAARLGLVRRGRSPGGSCRSPARRRAARRGRCRRARRRGRRAARRPRARGR